MEWLISTLEVMGVFIYLVFDRAALCVHGLCGAT